jgi:hypothetical protein
MNERRQQGIIPAEPAPSPPLSSAAKEGAEKEFRKAAKRQQEAKTSRWRRVSDYVKRTFGDREPWKEGAWDVDTLIYDDDEAERYGRSAFEVSLPASYVDRWGDEKTGTLTSYLQESYENPDNERIWNGYVEFYDDATGDSTVVARWTRKLDGEGTLENVLLAFGSKGNQYDYHMTDPRMPRVGSEGELIGDSLKGNGFATVFNGLAFLHHRQAGVKRVKVSAAWDGTYVWPKKGFSSTDSGYQLKAGLRREAGNFRGGTPSLIRDEAEADAVEMLIQRMDEIDAEIADSDKNEVELFSDPNFPGKVLTKEERDALLASRPDAKDFIWLLENERDGENHKERMSAVKKWIMDNAYFEGSMSMDDVPDDLKKFDKPAEPEEVPAPPVDNVGNIADLPIGVTGDGTVITAEDFDDRLLDLVNEEGEHREPYRFISVNDGRIEGDDPNFRGDFSSSVKRFTTIRIAADLTERGVVLQQNPDLKLVYSKLFDRFSWVRSPSDTVFEVSPDDPNYVRYGNLAVVDSIVKSWAEDSSSSTALLAHHVANEMFDLKAPSYAWDPSGYNYLDWSEKPAVAEVLATMYKLTQKDLQEMGVSSVRLYRGQSLALPSLRSGEDLRYISGNPLSDIVQKAVIDDLMNVVAGDDEGRRDEMLALFKDNWSPDLERALSAVLYRREREVSESPNNRPPIQPFSFYFEEVMNTRWGATNNSLGAILGDEEKQLLEHLFYQLIKGEGEQDLTGRSGKSTIRLDNISLNALSSFATTRTDARQFAGRDDGGIAVGLIGAFDVPVQRVVATPGSGFGASFEREMVVAGGGQISGDYTATYDRKLMWDLLRKVLSQADLLDEEDVPDNDEEDTLNQDDLNVVRTKTAPDRVTMLIADPIEDLAAQHRETRDWADVVAIDAGRRAEIADFYDRAPGTGDQIPADVRRAYEAFAGEVEEQFRVLTEDLGVTVEFVDEDPYRNFEELRDDFVTNRRIKVLRTSVTGSHPFLSDEQNDKFRAVHDAFGHLGTGRGFDRHGEEAAYLAHRSMFSADAGRAAATELRGQNAFLLVRGEFPEQKLLLLPEAMTKMLRVLVGVLVKAASKVPSGAQRDSDADNFYGKTGSHHVSCGRVVK